MRIVFFINSLEGGGAERVVSTLAFHIRSRGHELFILTLHPPRPAYNLPPDVEVRQLAASGLAVGPGKLLVLPLQVRLLRAEVKRIAPDLVVSFLARANLVHALSAGPDHSVPVVLSERVQATEHYRGSLTKLMMRRLVGVVYPRADAIIAISRGVKESLTDIGIPAGKVTVIHNPIDVTGMVPRTERSPMLDERSVHLTTSGRLVGFKDQKTIVRALHVVRRRGWNARLTIIGDGPLRKELQAEVRSLGLQEHVVFTGWVNTPHALVAAADIFMFSSRYEAFGNAITEAMACGLPVVSSDCPGGPQEILDGGRYGLLFPVGDPEAMADRVVELAGDRTLYERLQKAGLERAAQFAVEVIGEQYIATFEKVIAAHACL